MVYVPTAPPPISDPELRAFSLWLLEELRRLAVSAQETEIVQLRTRHTAPSRPREGMVVYADGTDWDPGSGEGLYYYKNTTWTAI